MSRCPDTQMPRCPDTHKPRCPDTQIPKSYFIAISTQKIACPPVLTMFCSRDVQNENENVVLVLVLFCSRLSFWDWERAENELRTSSSARSQLVLSSFSARSQLVLSWVHKKIANLQIICIIFIYLFIFINTLIWGWQTITEYYRTQEFRLWNFLDTIFFGYYRTQKMSWVGFYFIRLWYFVSAIFRSILACYKNYVLNPF